MSKHKTQPIITLNNTHADSLTLGKLKEYVKGYFIANLDGKQVVNKDKGITVILNKNSLRHVIHARNAGYVKYKAILLMDNMIENAEFCNFKNPDIDDDKDNIVGYMNFRTEAVIENKKQFFRIVVRITKQGKFYYDHVVRINK